ncbi:carbohydrate-binding module family 48 protein, partial [Tothia fuscella]
FVWEHAGASEVYATGTFDDWSKTVKLEKVGEAFEKTVDLPTGEKIFYRYVVDGNWTDNIFQRTEADEHGNVNNVFDS